MGAIALNGVTLGLVRDRYGPGTSAIRSILDFVETMRPFRRVDGVTDGLWRLLIGHVKAASHSLECMGIGSIEVSLADHARVIELHETDGAGPDSWHMRLAESFVRQQSRSIDALSELRRLAGPPLWPVSHLPNVVRPLLIAGGSQLLDPLPEEFRDGNWKIACQIEKWIWSAIQWEVIHSGDDSTNPFRLLVEIAADGLVPSHVVGDRSMVVGYGEVSASRTRI